jgi:hypothetical protein
VGSSVLKRRALALAFAVVGVIGVAGCKTHQVTTANLCIQVKQKGVTALPKVGYTADHLAAAQKCR